MCLPAATGTVAVMSPPPALLERPRTVGVPPAGRSSRPAGERVRVAGELQAVVVRALAAIADRASVARALLGVDDAAAAEQVAQIPLLALDALEELRRLLAAIGDDGLSAADRAGLAHDVHDSVGHGVSLAGVLAGAAQAVLPCDREAARRSLEQLGATVDDTARELGALLAPLELGGARRTAPARPRDVHALVREALAAGQRVALTVEGAALDDLPAGVLPSLHRVVQESLTNARKHAPGGAVAVRVDVGADAVCVEVVNAAATGPSAARAGGCRRGIAGMRERARLLGGELDAGPTADGGFRVRARLPRGR